MILEVIYAGCFDASARVPDLVKSPLPADTIDDSELPKSYDP